MDARRRFVGIGGQAKALSIPPGSTPATVKLKGIDGGPHKRRNMWFNSMIREEPYLAPEPWLNGLETVLSLPGPPGGVAWLSSARAVRCRLKCHNERNPFPRLPSGDGGHSVDTAAARVRGKAGMTSNQHGPYVRATHVLSNESAHRGMLIHREGAADPETRPEVPDWSLQPRLHEAGSLVIAHQPWRGEYVPGPCTPPVKP